MTEVTVVIAGHPAPAGVKRHARPWRETVRAAVDSAGANRHLQGPLAVDAVFYLDRPRNHYGRGRLRALRGDAPVYPDREPGACTYVVPLLDALAAAGVLGGESRVVSLAARTRWAEHGTPAGVRVTVRQLEGFFP